MSSSPQPLSSPNASGRNPVMEEVAYLAPMGAFLAFIAISGWFPRYAPLITCIKMFLAGGLIVLFWRHYTRIRWNHSLLGLIVGVVGIVQWVGQEKLLLHFFPKYPRLSAEIFDPFARDESGNLRHFPSETLLYLYIAIRWAGAVIVVPFMEELFWRDYLWRRWLSPNDIHLAEVGEFDWGAIFLVSAAFASVHIQWITALTWGLMIAWLLVRTKSIGACIIAHAVTNLLLGAYVLYRNDEFGWYLW